MIKQLIDEALVAHGFVSKRDLDNTSFYDPTHVIWTQA